MVSYQISEGIEGFLKQVPCTVEVETSLEEGLSELLTGLMARGEFTIGVQYYTSNKVVGYEVQDSITYDEQSDGFRVKREVTNSANEMDTDTTEFYCSPEEYCRNLLFANSITLIEISQGRTIKGRNEDPDWDLSDWIKINMSDRIETTGLIYTPPNGEPPLHPPSPFIVESEIHSHMTISFEPTTFDPYNP